MRPLLSLKDITKTYRLGQRNLEILKGITLDIDEGAFVSIMGPSGSGKSTLMHIIGCLDIPSGGTYRLGDADITHASSGQLVQLRRKYIGFVFQNFNLLPRLTAAENVALPLVYSGGKDRAKRAKETLALVGLADRANHRPTELSGGEQQRVAIARALINNPKVLLADEPTGNLDSASGADIVQLFQRLHHERRTVILVTHDATIANTAERTIHLRDGRIAS